MGLGDMTKAKPYSDQKNWSNTYLTDPKILKIIGPFDTDPCWLQMKIGGVLYRRETS